METTAERLSQFTHRLTYDELPDPVVRAAKQHILDALGVSLASSTMNFARSAVRVVAAMGGSPDAAIIGNGLRAPAANATLANGVMAHGIDYDDTHSGSITHTSSCVVPSALAIGEMVGASGREYLTAVVAGYESTIRIGLAAPSQFHRRGFHTTPIAGTFGAAVVSAKLLGLDPEQTTNALGLCGSQAAGIRAYRLDGTWNKRLHAGWASHAGVISALLAREGFTGAHWVFDGEYGIYQTYLGDAPARPETIVEALGSRWETPNIAFKPYPCGHIIHAFVDCLLDLRREYGLRPDNVAAIECPIGDLEATIVCEPLERKLRPPDPYTALFSLQYGLALALEHGEVGLGGYTEEEIRNQRLLDVAGLVTWTPNPGSEYPAHFGGTVRVTTTDGRVLERSERDSLGSPDNPLDEEAVIRKFRQNAGLAMDPGRAEQLLETVMGLEQVDSVHRLAELCQP